MGEGRSDMGKSRDGSRLLGVIWWLKPLMRHVDSIFENLAEVEFE